LHSYFVYILANRSRTLYIGVTSDLGLRVAQHRAGAVPGFTQKYRIDRLVYFEQFQWIQDAIAREKQLKGWTRAKKTALIEEQNPAWDDLSEDVTLKTDSSTIMPSQDDSIDT